MKKAIFILVVVVVLLSSFAVFASASAERMYVTGKNVNERTEPTTESKVVERHNRGKDVEVVADNGEWAMLENGNFMSMEYLAPEEGAEELFYNAPMYVLGDHVRERTAPNTEAQVAVEHLAGEQVMVAVRHNGWYELTNGNYIRMDLLSPDFQDIVPHFLESYKDLVVVYISDQKVEYWKYDELVASDSCVTGHAKNSPTPIGLYTIGSKNADFDMNQNPRTHVQYACYFNGGIALHDAVAWRSHYGGDIYKTNGSHGCVNLRLDMARFIYENSRKGHTYVLVLP